MRTRVLMWVLPFAAALLVAATVASFRVVDDRAAARQADVRQQACLQGTRLIEIAADLIEENAALLEANFADLVRARTARGEPRLARESRVLLARAKRARVRVGDIRRIAAARDCDQ